MPPPGHVSEPYSGELCPALIYSLLDVAEELVFIEMQIKYHIFSLQKSLLYFPVLSRPDCAEKSYDYVLEPSPVALPLVEPLQTRVVQVACGRAHSLVLTDQEGGKRCRPPAPDLTQTYKHWFLTTIVAHQNLFFFNFDELLLCLCQITEWFIGILF